MYIVYIRNKKHSAWDTKVLAYHQLTVLKEYGYKAVKVIFEDVAAFNGYYFM